MTLRLRLVLALVGLLAVGLALFGFSTYSLYSRSEYQRLDDQIQSSVVLVSRVLEESSASTSNSNGAPNSGNPGGGPLGNSGFGPGPGEGNTPRGSLPPGTYAERRDKDGAVVGNSVEIISTSARPKLPDTLIAAPGTKHFFTTGSVKGSGQWRVLVAPDPGGDGTSVVVAVPMGEVTSALNNLILTEVAVALALLVVLSLGSWLILRRGLHPLEQMSTTAGQITAGDLTQRVSPSGGPTEVGQLGLALNTMLDDIEEAFHERDLTEQRLRQFLADASHELRTPITSIQGFAELFRVGAEDAQVDLPTILRRIEDESARMRGLVEDLLLLARLDQVREAETEPVDLAVLAADACSDAVAADRQRKVTLDAPEPVVVVRRPGPPAPGRGEPREQRADPHPVGDAARGQRPARRRVRHDHRARPRPGPRRGRPRPRLRPLLAGGSGAGRVGRRTGPGHRGGHRRRARRLGIGHQRRGGRRGLHAPPPDSAPEGRDHAPGGCERPRRAVDGVARCAALSGPRRPVWCL